MTLENEQALSRREFVRRTLRAGITLAAVGGVGLWRFDPKGPEPPGAGEQVNLPDYSVPGTKGRMSVIRGSDRPATLAKAVTGIGGIEAYVHPGDRVLIKVNAAFASPPILSATTHPDLVRGLVRLCFQAGAAAVVVTDNPINDPASCFRLTGIGEAAESEGARVFVPEPGAFQAATLEGGRLIRNWPLLYEPFRGIDKLIGVAPVKDHHRSGASMIMKNWYGLLGGPRNLFHQDIHNIIKELALLVTPTFVILDGTWTMMANGPTGGSIDDLKATHTLIAATDQVAADAFGATLLGKRPADLPWIAKAEEAGAGTADFEALRPLIGEA